MNKAKDGYCQVWRCAANALNDIHDLTIAVALKAFRLSCDS